MKKTLLTLLIIFFAPAVVHSESLTVPTYYTAPFGSYDRIHLVPRATLPAGCDIGTMYVESATGVISYCANDGSGNGIWGPLGGLWIQNGNNLYPLDNGNSDLKVGLGTDTPMNKLEVVGDINISEFSAYKINGRPVLAASDDQIFFGTDAGISNTTGRYNTFLGYQAGLSNTSGEGNTFVGYRSGYENIAGSRNTFFGYKAGESNTSGSRNTFLGSQAGQSNTSGSDNTFLGMMAGYSNLQGDRNTYLGYLAGRNATTDSNSLLTAHDNTFIGSEAGRDTTVGSRNVFIGIQAAMNHTTGQDNVAVGRLAALNMSAGVNNVYLGDSAGYSSGAASQNTYIGKDAGHDAPGSNNVFIGYTAGYSEAGSNKLHITNGSGASPLIYGDFNTRQVAIDTTTLLGEKLTVPGGVYIHSTTTGLEIDTEDSGTYETKLIARPNTGTNQSALAFYTAPGAASQDQVERMRIDRFGNVGIGTPTPNVSLTVDALMRLQPTDAPASCDLGIQGGIYYDLSMSELCYCNGASWRQFDGGGNCN